MTKELHRGEEKHIQLREGTVYNTGTKNSKNRTLELATIYLLELQENIQFARLGMLQAI